MGAAILDFLRAVGDFLTHAAPRIANSWARFFIFFTVLALLGIPLANFALGANGVHGVVPYIGMISIALLLVLAMWRPVVLALFFVPWGGVGAGARWLVVSGILLGIFFAFTGGWVPWQEHPGLAPWFALATLGLVVTAFASASKFITFVRRALVIILVGLALLAYYYAGTLKPAERVVEAGVKAFTSQPSPACIKDETGLFGCFGLRRVSESPTRIDYEVFHQPGSPHFYKGKLSVWMNGNGGCEGRAHLTSVGSTAGEEWDMRIVPVRCESLSSFDTDYLSTSSWGNRAGARFFFRKDSI